MKYITIERALTLEDGFGFLTNPVACEDFEVLDYPEFTEALRRLRRAQQEVADHLQKFTTSLKSQQAINTMAIL